MDSKLCIRCLEFLPLNAFQVSSERPGGIKNVCKECINARSSLKRWIKAGRPLAEPLSPGLKRCTACLRALPHADFAMSTHGKDGLNPQCRACKSAQYYERRERRLSSPRPEVSEKWCKECGLTKPIGEFPAMAISIDGHGCRCKPCHAIKKAASFQKNYARNYARERERLLKRTAEKSEEVRLFVATYKYERGCAECGERNPVCLDFHHREGTVKLHLISKMTGVKTSRAKLLAEIEKCSILCANCHRKRHGKTFRYMKRWMEEEALPASSSQPQTLRLRGF